MSIDNSMGLSRACWCGNELLEPFGRQYLVCRTCETLVSQAGLSDDELAVKDDDVDFYGKQYWLDHQNKSVAFPDIYKRARTDLSERALYWLRTLLKYKSPPASALEIGCSHGGFVALMRQAGFDATGMEISPWVVGFARDTFSIPVELGPIENMAVPQASYDILAAMDVAEHLAHPVETFLACAEKLRTSGMFLIQTPSYPEGTTLRQLENRHDRFLDMLLPKEHLYLFSRSALVKLFGSIGFPHVTFEPAIFHHYDMFAVASRVPINVLPPGDIDAYLAGTAATRILQAFLDLYTQDETNRQALETALRDSTLRLDQINTLANRLEESEADRAARLVSIHQLEAQLTLEMVEKQQVKAELDPVPVFVRLLFKTIDRAAKRVLQKSRTKARP